MYSVHAFSVSFPPKSHVACCGVMLGYEGRDVVDKGRGAFTSSRRGGEEPVPCARGWTSTGCALCPSPTPSLSLVLGKSGLF